MRTRTRTVQPAFSFEYIMWIFMRLSGLGLILMAVIGVTGAFTMGARTQMTLPTLMRWTFFPNPNHIISSDIPDLFAWTTGFWQIMQMLIIIFGATHAFNGLRNVIEDFTKHSVLQPILRGLIVLLWAFVLIVAIYVILAS